MAIPWTKHRFSGGLLVLDTANTVVLRGDRRTFDRFGEASEIGRFADAASVFRSAELGSRRLAVANAKAVAGRVIELREAADRLFRTAASAGSIAVAELPRLLRACAACLDDSADCMGGHGMPFGNPAQPLRFEAALAISALSLLAGDAWRKIRICPNCNWLFLDRSRNSSRLWCDMSVCGNRNKAKRHYQRRTTAGKGLVDA